MSLLGNRFSISRNRSIMSAIFSSVVIPCLQRLEMLDKIHIGVEVFAENFLRLEFLIFRDFTITYFF